ncbi:Ca2+-binding RTX toxin-like protein [Aliiruegeria haliotis]|uniref:Ca2+-binding RTX toxin-like protein n=1 Tax=Aliiruegeria haliotis TaxID=1280846 RepID=A0A2T0S080_9RHOB|nr:calcium-binding protein [Aliiruegeria haliotis]PRY26839.1 Ca2+-binding RTX toxin-like protein [Aliiruegeria haliotis]
MVVQVAFSSSQSRMGKVGTDMFGGNFLIDRDRMGQGTYDDAVRALNLSNLRYPGGSITEWYFDINDPDKARVWAPERGEYRDLLPLSDFLSQSASLGVGVNLVIPTGALLGNGAIGLRQPLGSAYADVKRYVSDVLAGKYGDADITTIEIGNEYWLSGEMTDDEYAAVASVVAEAAQAAIDDHRASGAAPEGWVEPEIAVQVGQYGAFSTEPGIAQNETIMASLSNGAAQAIDAVVVHYYTWGSYAELENFEYFFDRLDTWEYNGRFEGIEYHVTEWNAANGRSAEQGLKQASTLVWMFSEMVAQGVDAAYVWPVQQNTLNKLTGNEGDPVLSIAGETFRLLSESVAGKTLVRHEDLGDAGDVFVYEKGAETVVFVNSRKAQTEAFTLDLKALGVAGQFYWTTELGSDGKPGDAFAQPVLTISAGVPNAAASATFDIGAYGVLRITFLDAGQDGAAVDRPDVYDGSAGRDVIRGSAAGDVLQGLGGADEITGGVGRDRLNGGDGNDRIHAGNQADVIVGGAGNDVVHGGRGADVAHLGEGNDTYNESLQSGPTGADTAYGGAGHDRLNGGGGADVLNGGSGADRLSGGRGADRLEGEAGNDLLQGNDGGDRLFGGAGDDVIHGGGGNDRIRAGSGDDLVRAGYGRDVVDLGTGDDTFLGSAEDGRRGIDVVYGGAGNDTLTAYGGADRLFGEDGHDKLAGGTGDDRLDGGRGGDEIWGGDGDDTLLGRGGNDNLRGGAGADVLRGHDGRDVLRGDAGDDHILGNAGVDVLDGWTGNDILSGGDGDDWLVGGDGRDVLDGGAGADVFVFDRADGVDRILAFTEADRIRITSGAENLGDLKITRQDDGATIRFAETTIEIDMLAANLGSSDFTFA